MNAEPRKIRSNGQEVRFLIVDDDHIVVMAIKRALKKLNATNELLSAVDGVEALQLLTDDNGKTSIDRPFIVVLDINMPRMNGLELLSEIRADAAIRSTVVFMLTTSDAPEDICSAYEKNIAGYILKDDLVGSFENAIALLDRYSETVILPT